MRMRCLVCSDIHGSLSAAEKLVEGFFAEKCDLLILLGDVLYHGPRNPLPVRYNPQGVAAKLNKIAAKIVACRGNCDSEVDQMLLSFPIMADSALVFDGGRRIFATHGHIRSPENLPPLAPGDIFLSGHTHIQGVQRTDGGILLCNPGSASLPKGESPPGFAILEDGTASLRALD